MTNDFVTFPSAVFHVMAVTIESELLPIAWGLLVVLLLLGLIGCLAPVLPGHLLIAFAAVVHRLLLGEASGLNRWTFLALFCLCGLAQWMEWLSGAVGAKWFGGSKWSSWGALLGGFVGIFFFPFGLLLGPLIGAFVFEKWLAKKDLRPSLAAGFGSMVGAVAGMVAQIIVGLVMVGWILIDIIWGP